MDRIFPLDQLEIIGCREVPAKDPTMPRLLSAIFAVRDSETVLFPPYTLGEQEVIGPMISNREEFGDLVAAEEVSPHDFGQARPGHELWLDDGGIVNYAPDHEARTKLAAIFQDRCELAKEALGTGSWLEARTHAMVAYSANTRNLKPLVYRAAAEHLLAAAESDPGKIHAELALTELIAKTHLSAEEFRKLYLELAAVSFRKSTTAVASTTAPSQSRSKLSGLAKQKPAPPSIDFPVLKAAA